MKKNNLLALAILALSSASFAETYVVRAAVEGVRPLYTWQYAEPLYGEWSATSQPTCGDWLPSEINFTNAGDFLQSQDCSQGKTRTVQERQYSPEKDEYKLGSIRSESIDESSVNQRIYSINFTNWTASGAPTCQAWSPDAASTYSLVDFTQSQTCSTNYARQKQESIDSTLVKSTGETKSEDSSNNRTVSVAVGAWTAGANYGCGTWSPDPSTVANGTSFTQTRSCMKDNARNVVYSVAGAGTIRTIPETQTGIAVSEQRTATGTLVSECRSFNQSHNEFVVTTFYPQNSWDNIRYQLTIRWGDTIITTANGYSNTTQGQDVYNSFSSGFVSGGYRYTKGTYSTNYTSPSGLNVYDYYAVCRVPVTP